MKHLDNGIYVHNRARLVSASHGGWCRWAIEVERKMSESLQISWWLWRRKDRWRPLPESLMKLVEHFRCPKSLLPYAPFNQGPSSYVRWIVNSKRVNSNYWASNAVSDGNHITLPTTCLPNGVFPDALSPLTMQRGSSSYRTDIEKDGGAQDFVLRWSELTYQCGGKTILDGVSGQIRSGELLAVMGPSGERALIRVFSRF